jgi:hypothetical protein
MSSTRVKYEIIEHDYDSSCTSSIGFIELGIIPSKEELFNAISKMDYYMSFVNRDNLAYTIPNGKLPGVLRLFWKDDNRPAYTIKPV